MATKNKLGAFLIGFTLFLFLSLVPGSGEAARSYKPLSPDSHLGPERSICCNDEYAQHRPSVVYNPHHSEYLVVYHNDYAPSLVAGARVGLDGYPFSWFALGGFSPIISAYPDVAYNRTNDEYLVVWQQYNSSQNKWEIYGRFVPWDGPKLPSQHIPFLIAEWSGLDLKYPRVAWNSFRNEYMVVWQTEGFLGQLLGIGRRRIGPGGGLLSNADFIYQVNFPANPDIAYNPAADQFLVVWAQLGNSSIDIYGGRLNREGALQGSIFPIGDADNEQQLPVVTTNEQDRYLVVWQDDRIVQGDWDIFAQFLDVGGNKVGGSFWLAVSTDNETHPAMAVNGGSDQYLVVYQKTTLSGESLQADLFDRNGFFVERFEVAPGGFGDNVAPTVGSHPSGYFMTYEWTSWEPGSTSDLYGRMWSPQAVFLPLVVRGSP